MLFNGKENGPKVKEWVIKMEEEIVEKVDTVKDMTESHLSRIMDEVKAKYEKIKDIDKDLAISNGAHWQSLNRLPKLIFDHSSMVERALKDLTVQARIKPVGFELLPSKFTLVQLLDLYSAIYRKQIDKRNFRKKILSMDILEKLDEKEKETSKKGAYYYRFIKSRYNKFIKNGFYFNLDVG